MRHEGVGLEMYKDFKRLLSVAIKLGLIPTLVVGLGYVG